MMAPIKLTRNLFLHCLGCPSGVNIAAITVVIRLAGKVNTNIKIAAAILNHPVSISKDCYAAAVFTDTIDIHLIRPNHKVHMDIRAVETCCF